MNKKMSKRVSAFILCGALLASGTANIIPAFNMSNLSVSATSIDKTVTSNGLTYEYVVTAKNCCTLYKIYDNSKKTVDKYNELVIPEIIPGTSYKITELGNNKEAVIDSQYVNRITLPKNVKRINACAFNAGSVRSLTYLYLHLDTLEYCDSSAFSGTYLAHIYSYNNSTQKYDSLDTVDGFNKYFGLNSQEFTAISGDHFKLRNSAYDGELTFLNAVDASPYVKNLGYEFAKKIAKENGFDSAKISKQNKLIMIYNYLVSNLRYSALRTSKDEVMESIMGSSLSALALNSGVCGAHAHAFEQLCKASGLKVGNTIQDSEVVCIGLPGHAANAVRMSSNEGYYMVDVSAHKFMTAVDRNTNAVIECAYLYGNKPASDTVIDYTFSKKNLINKDFCEGNSFVTIQSDVSTPLKIEICDPNNAANKFISYTATGNTVTGNTYRTSEFANTNSLPLYVSSYSYLSLKIGGVSVKTEKNQTVTINGVKYKVDFETLTYAKTNLPAASAYKDYYRLTIKKA